MIIIVLTCMKKKIKKKMKKTIEDTNAGKPYYLGFRTIGDESQVA
jgi:hypothetical protein